MLGVVLCGGQSSRMGTDKGLLIANTATWAQMAVSKISTLGLTVVVSVNRHQYADYSKIFAANALVKDDEDLNIRGPLNGVLSVHNQNPSEDLFVLACDMPLMESFILKELLQHYQKNNAFGAYLFTNEGEPEPLCGIYSANSLSSTMKMYQNGSLKKHSMKFMIENLEVFFAPIPADNKKYFQNFNTHAELNDPQ